MNNYLKQIFTINPNYKLVNMNLKIHIHKNNLLKNICSLCNSLPQWNNQELQLHLDHINGNIYDNRLENLRFLCLNCHSQTKTFCRKKSTQELNIPIKEFKSMVACSKNWHDLAKRYNGKSYVEFIKKVVKKENIDVSHFKHNKTNKLGYKYKLKDLLILNSDYKPKNQVLKKRLIEENIVKDMCSICNQSTIWNNKKLVLHLDHINGNKYDNRIENIRIICPNCHSQTNTYCGKKNKVDYNILSNKQKFDTVLKQLMRYFSKNKGGRCQDCNIRIYVKSKRCNECNRKNSIQYKRKVKNRPSVEQLLREVKETSYVAVGRKYGVADTTIKKWIKNGLKSTNTKKLKK